MDRATQASKELHESSSDYGASKEYFNPYSMKALLTIDYAIARAQKIESIESFLDHGTGQGGLIEFIKSSTEAKVLAQGYDPCVEKYSEKPNRSFDIVTSIDVLEHIDRSSINELLSDIKSLTRKFFFFCIDLYPASKRLLDGRNAHILLAPPDWWAQQIKFHFPIMNCIEVGITEDGNPHPMHLFGCATNSMTHFDSMNEFLKGVKIANRQWILSKTGVLSSIPFHQAFNSPCQQKD